MDQIVDYHNCEAARNGENAEDHVHHWQATAHEAIAQQKCYHAGMHVDCGKFQLGPDLIDCMVERKNLQNRKKGEKIQRTRGEYDALLNGVNKVRQADKLPEQWMVAQLKTMVKWYKHDGDNAIPAKKTIYSPDTMPPTTGEHEFHHQCMLLLLFLLLRLRPMVVAMTMKKQGAIMILQMKMKAAMMMTIPVASLCEC